MISCLCITRGDRPGLLSEAVSDFVRQTFADRELVILHDGDEAAHAAVAAIVAAHAGASIRIERTPPGPRLGELRNIAIGRARGEWIVTGTPPPPRLRRPAERDLGFDSTM